MEFSHPTLSPSSSTLLCPESQTTFDCNQLDDSVSEGDDKEDNDEEEEYLLILLNREINGNGVLKQDIDFALTVSWIKQARIDAINYIFRTGLAFGFEIQTGYLAVTYMDRFLSRKLIKDEKYWIVALLGIACLSLAAKMEECNVPGISELVEKKYKFESRMVQRMELIVMDTLEWKMKLITPFPFIHYFVSKLYCKTNISTCVSKVIEILLKMIKDEMTIQDSPSAVAAAATLFTFDQALTKESLGHKLNPLYCSTFLNIEEILSLYNRFKLHGTRSSEHSNISPPFSPFRLGYALENPTKTPYAVGSKRKSLTFGQSSKNIDGDDDDDEDENTKRPC